MTDHANTMVLAIDEEEIALSISSQTFALAPSGDSRGSRRTAVTAE